jgi:hypothetical protein
MNILFLLSLFLTPITFASEARTPIVNVTYKYIIFTPSHEDLKPLLLLAQSAAAHYLGYSSQDFETKYGPFFEKMKNILETANDSGPVDLRPAEAEYYEQLQQKENENEIFEYIIMSSYIKDILSLFRFLNQESLLLSPDKPSLNPIQKVARLIRFAQEFKLFPYKRTKDDTKSNISMYQPILSGDTIKIIFVTASNASSFKEAHSKLTQRLNLLISSTKEISVSEARTFNHMSSIRYLRNIFLQIQRIPSQVIIIASNSFSK